MSDHKGNSEEEPQEKWGCSSVGRAPALQAGGHGFESHHLHQWQVATARDREAEEKSVITTPEGDEGERLTKIGERERDTPVDNLMGS